MEQYALSIFMKQNRLFMEQNRLIYFRYLLNSYLFCNIINLCLLGTIHLKSVQLKNEIPKQKIELYI